MPPVTFHGEGDEGEGVHAKLLQGWGKVGVIILIGVHVIAFCFWLYLLWKTRGAKLMTKAPSRDNLRRMDPAKLKVPQRFIRFPTKQK